MSISCFFLTILIPLSQHLTVLFDPPPFLSEERRDEEEKIVGMSGRGSIVSATKCNIAFPVVLTSDREYSKCKK